MQLVESLSLAGSHLSSFRYLNPRPANGSAGRHASDSLDDIIYDYSDTSFLEEFRVTRDTFWK